jgi:phosphoglycerate-specific signal transduction histidine kinase
MLARLDRLATTSLLATGLAHELANPLASLVLSLDWTNERIDRLRKQGSAAAADLERLAPDLELARISTDAITAMLRDFQLFLRPNEITPIIGPCEVKPAVVRAIQMARVRLATVSPVSVQLEDVPMVRTPSTRITQIVLNLLLNAADALTDRAWSANQIDVRVYTAEGRATIDVRDNGPGLSPEVKRHLFEPGRSTKTNSESLGSVSRSRASWRVCRAATSGSRPRPATARCSASSSRPPPNSPCPAKRDTLTRRGAEDARAYSSHWSRLCGLAGRPGIRAQVPRRGRVRRQQGEG